jgi:hypothetical protein
LEQIEIEWEGVEYVVSLAPHDMTDNRISLDQGFLVNLEVLDFHLEYWCKELIAAAFYPFGSVCLTGTDFSAISLCLNIKQAWLPRRILINAGPEGIMFKIRINGYVNLNTASGPPSPLGSIQNIPNPANIPIPANPLAANDDAPLLPRNPEAIRSRLDFSSTHRQATTRARAPSRSQSTPPAARVPPSENTPLLSPDFLRLSPRPPQKDAHQLSPSSSMQVSVGVSGFILQPWDVLGGEVSSLAPALLEPSGSVQSSFSPLTSPPLLPLEELEAAQPQLPQEQEIPIMIPFQDIVPPQVVAPADEIVLEQNIVPAQEIASMQGMDLAPELIEDGPRCNSRIAVAYSGLVCQHSGEGPQEEEARR